MEGNAPSFPRVDSAATTERLSQNWIKRFCWVAQHRPRCARTLCEPTLLDARAARGRACATFFPLFSTLLDSFETASPSLPLSLRAEMTKHFTPLPDF